MSQKVSKTMAFFLEFMETHNTYHGTPYHLILCKLVISFLVNYSEENGLLFPGRIPGYFSTDLKLLPSSRS